jgi:hypothetical protein
MTGGFGRLRSLTEAFGVSLAKRIGAGAHCGELARKLPLHYPLRCRPKECFKQASGSGQFGG